MAVIHRFEGVGGGWAWQGVPVQDYGAQRPGITVQRFISRADGSSNLELRYFELQPRSHSNWEQHNYEHAVLVLRGHGAVRLGEECAQVAAGDVIFIAAGEVHEFVAADDDCLGFMCAVLDRQVRPMVHGEQWLKSFT